MTEKGSGEEKDRGSKTGQEEPSDCGAGLIPENSPGKEDLGRKILRPWLSSAARISP